VEAEYEVVCNKEITLGEFAWLMESVGYDRAGHYAAEVFEHSLAAYPFVAHARDAGGRLVGYISAFSDGAFSTFVGELLVHPHAQRRGVGTRLLEAVEARFAGVPVIVHPSLNVQAFYLARGYRRPAPSMAAFSQLDPAR
jgi:GNAT superfamily N-acetyltransferase